MGRDEPLTTMVRCMTSDCRRWQSMTVGDMTAALAVALRCCTFCGGELELVDMAKHVASLPASDEVANIKSGGVVLEVKK